MFAPALRALDPLPADVFKRARLRAYLRMDTVDFSPPSAGTGNAQWRRAGPALRRPRHRNPAGIPQRAPANRSHHNAPEAGAAWPRAAANRMAQHGASRG